MGSDSSQQSASSQELSTGTEDYKREMDELLESGWDIKTESPDRVVMIKKDFGAVVPHILILVFLGWWLLLIPNVLYAAYKYTNSPQRIIRKN